MISRRFIVIACFILPFLFNNCSFLSKDLDAEGENEDNSELNLISEELVNISDENNDSVLGNNSQIQAGEMPLDELNLEVRKFHLIKLRPERGK